MADGGELTDAQPAFDQQSHEPMVSFKFNLRGARSASAQATSENVGRAWRSCSTTRWSRPR